MATEVRGSEKLLSDLIRKGSAATPEEVKAAVAIPAGFDYKLLNWHVRGIAPIDYVLETQFQVHPSQVSDLVDRFVANEKIQGINIMIYGTPLPDIAHVSATVAQIGKA
jgi:hypothetical protein